jgi:drug/metabolite transporter (DMT)-like permease
MTSIIRKHPRLALILAMLLWGASFPAMKHSIGAMSSFGVVWIRMGIGSLILLPALFAFIKKPTYQKGDWRWLSLMVISEPCLYFFFEIQALRLTSATQAGFIAATLPLMVLGMSAWLLKERIRKPAIAGIAVAFCGVLLLTATSEANESSPNAWLGNAFELLAMLSATSFTYALKRLGNRYDPLFLTWLQCAVGFIVFARGGFPLEQWAVVSESRELVLVLLFLGAGVTVGAYALYIGALQQTPANEAILMVNLIPLFGMGISLLLLKETLTAPQWLACGIVLLGVIIGQMGVRDTPTPITGTCPAA